MAYSIRSVKSGFLKLLHALSPEDVAVSPGRDFSRNRKCSLFDTILILLTMAGHSLGTELDNYFLSRSKDPPSKSAFVQQRSKLASGALYTVFSRFNALFPFRKTYKGLHLFASDGTDVNIPSLPGDKDNSVSYPSRKGCFYQMHLNALYDLLEKRYVDAVLCPKRKTGENASLCDMVDRNRDMGRILYIADGGYNCFNTFAHIIKAGHFFLIRAKDPSCHSSFLSTIQLPDTEEFDIGISLVLCRKKKTSPEKTQVFKRLSKKQRFDFIPPDDRKSTFSIPMRVVKVRIGENNFEYLVTNLPGKKFPAGEIKDLYRIRWGIETSFRQLKYNLALAYFHSRKREFIEQEVFARLTIYNFVSLMSGNVTIEPSEDNKHEYKVAFSEAVSLCRKLLLGLIDVGKLKTLLKQRLSPIRPGRSSPRNLRSQQLRTLNNRA